MDLKSYITEYVVSRRNKNGLRPDVVNRISSVTRLSDFVDELSVLTGYKTSKTYTYTKDRVYDTETILADFSGSFSNYACIALRDHLYVVTFSVDYEEIPGIVRITRYDVKKGSDYVKPIYKTEKIYDNAEDGIYDLLSDI